MVRRAYARTRRSVGIFVLLWVASCGGLNPTPSRVQFASSPDGNHPHSPAPHARLFLEDRYPSANACRTCHPRHYRQWAASPHAYAQLSPIFNAMHGTILKLTNGTSGDFCIRCHTPVGMAIGEPLFVSNLDRHPTSREGITCVACHRLDKPLGKVSGRRGLEEGSVLTPVRGPTGGDEVRRVIDDPDFRVITDEGTGRLIHRDVVNFPQLTEPGFCGSCHDVTLPNGFRLEEAFSEYKSSPAARNGVTCQDCHMGTEPGVPSGYAKGPAAIVGGVPTRTRKLTNHSFVGPDHSVVHPALFPHNPEAQELATLQEWLTFDVDAGWGTDGFEAGATNDEDFPARWRSEDDRYEARDLIDAQIERLAEITAQRRQLLRHGYQIGEVVTDPANSNGLRFRVQILNATEGHNVPTGFTAERRVYLEVTVRDAQGRVLLKSGDLDPNGDLRDHHSLYVHNGELPPDEQLFSLQSKFITRNVRGGEREQVLAVNTSLDALPYVHPEVFASVLTGRPRDTRLHKTGIEPGGSRWADYRVIPAVLTGRSPYEIDLKLIAGMVPVNLLNAIKDVGFDYGLSARDLAERVVAGHLVLWERSIRVPASDVP